MKNIIYLLVGMLSLTMASCQRAEEEKTDGRPMAALSVRATTTRQAAINGWDGNEPEEIVIDRVEEVTRAAEEVVGRMAFVLMDEDGNKVVEQEKSSDEDDYLSLYAEVPVGDYTLIAFGHNGASDASIGSDGTITPPGSKLTDSFLFCEDISLTETSDDSREITLDRCVALIYIHHTDKIPDDAAEVEISWTGGGKVLDARTSLAKETTGQSVSLSIPTSVVGQSGKKFGVYTFLPSEECVVDVVAKSKDAGGDVITSHQIDDVPVEVNMVTVCSGVFFHASQGMEVTVNSEWKPETTVPF